MYLLRKVTGTRWKGANVADTEHVHKAVRDVTPRPKEHLSVYEVTEADARDIALRWTAAHDPCVDESLDFLLIPDDLVPAGCLMASSDESTDHVLVEQHREIMFGDDFTPTTLAEGVIRRGPRLFRIPRKELLEYVRSSRQQQG